MKWFGWKLLGTRPWGLGTCYKAANWIYLGQTMGRGKDDHTNRVNRSLKWVFEYPLRADFREALYGQ